MREWYRNERFDGKAPKVPKAKPVKESDDADRDRAELIRKRNEGNRLRSQKQEKEAATRYGGRVKPGSGSSPLSKGDVKTRAFLMEMKCTIHGSISIKGEWLEKIAGEARYEGREPALEIQIDGITDPLVEKKWVLIPATLFADLNEEATIKRNA